MSNKDFNKKFSPQTGKDNLSQKPASTTQYTHGKTDTRTQPGQGNATFNKPVGAGITNPTKSADKGAMPRDRQRS